MKKQILDYLALVEKRLADADEQFDYNALASEYLMKITMYQHERLIHLIVTVLFALMETVVIVASVFSEGIGLSILAVAILILLIPYIGHYYFLENTVQKMYLQYDDIMKMCKDKMNTTANK